MRGALAGSPDATQTCLCFTNLLLDMQVREAKARGRPYTIVFVGVNGVGKSTNLAKVAYWLLQNDVSVRARLPRRSVMSRMPGILVVGS